MQDTKEQNNIKSKVIKIKEFFTKNEKIFLWLFFIFFNVINFYLMLIHEPWRDEIHAWTMAKYLSIPDLFIVSRFDRTSCAVAIIIDAFCQKWISNYYT